MKARYPALFQTRIAIVDNRHFNTYNNHDIGNFKKRRCRSTKSGDKVVECVEQDWFVLHYAGMGKVAALIAKREKEMEAMMSTMGLGQDAR